MLQLDELVGFTVPEWMLEKMRCQMRLMRTDIGGRAAKLIHDSITPVISSQVYTCPFINIAVCLLTGRISKSISSANTCISICLQLGKTTVSDHCQKYTYLFPFHAKRVRVRVRVAVRFSSLSLSWLSQQHITSQNLSVYTNHDLYT